MKILITGGIKSGKSFYALKRAREKEGKKGFIATALVKDDDMARRVKQHQQERGTEFETIEEPYELGRALKFGDRRYSVTVIDCLTMWLLNIMEEKLNVEQESENFLKILKDTSSEIIIVTNEVSSGIIPPDEYSRRFLENLSEINLKVAQLSDEVILMVAGIPLVVKGERG